jgi:hypothetical protein
MMEEVEARSKADPSVEEIVRDGMKATEKKRTA